MKSHEIDYEILGDDLQLVEVELDPRETVIADEQGIEYSIERAGNLKSMLFGGEGLFLATLQGTGSVWLQSLPFSRLADRILANAPREGGKNTGENRNPLGNLFQMLS